VQELKRAVVEGVTLEYEDQGTGEPVVCIHGAFIADTFGPLLADSAWEGRYRLINYHRRGYAGSSPARKPLSMAEQAADCVRLLSHLGMANVHVVGHSLGGSIGLQLALDAPGLVHTLTLLEAAGVAGGESAALYRQGLTRSLERYREAGPVVAVDEFLRMRCPDYRDILQRVLPQAFEQAVADAGTFFEAELPVVLDWQFGEDDARRIAQPALVVLGERSVALHPRFAETHRLLMTWLPNAAEYVLPDATHLLQVESPDAMAQALAGFLARHPLGTSPTA
jgi:pimeloyl-ACP methyl ester carboxylesterase